jgi:hypothetical protein
VVLPITADISDVELSIVNEEVPNGVIAQLNYTYDGHIAGRVDVVLSNAKVEDSYFEEKEDSSDKNVIEIQKKHILLVLGILVLLVVLVFVGKKLYDNFYVILHDMRARRKRKDRFRPVSRRRRRRRRRDRMFK